MLCKKPTAGIVLAAGMSSRFGRPKQLLMLGGKPVLEWTLNACLNSQLESIYLVLGYKHHDVVKALSGLADHPRLNIILNQNYTKGQSASLQAGILEAGDTFPSVMFVLGDQPLIDSQTIDDLLTCFWDSDKSICAPFYKNKRGNPVIFSRIYYDMICSIKGDMGARRIIEQHPDQVLKIAVKQPSFFHDIDTPEDFEKAQSFISL